MSLVFDHLVIGARTLAEGVAWLQQVAGISLPPGGQHPLMGTHNHLGRLSATSFLEILAVDPTAPDPGRPRWLGMSDPHLQAQLAERPRPIAWMAAVPDLAQALATAGEQAPLYGEPVAASRGVFTWQLSVRPDGALPRGGVWPVLIEWPADRPHVAAAMPDSGLRLQALVARDPDPVGAVAGLRRIGADRLIAVQGGEGFGLTALFTDAAGRSVVLR